MNTELNPEEAQTKRMSAPPPASPALAADQTRRMETRAGAPAPVDQDAIPTLHAAVTNNGQLAHTTSAPSSIAPLGALEPGRVLLGDCVVVRTYHNHESGRPGLFECQAPEGHVMVKVAATEFPPQPELWNKLSQLDHPHVLRIFRTVEEDGRFYEVQEFCAGGTLADYVPSVGSGRLVPPTNWVEQSLVPSFHAGISYLHSQGIVHRDIKPSNLYLREANGRKTLVLGDFDISSVLHTGRTSRSTQRAAGTWVYSAPEAFPRFVDEGASQLGSAVVRSSDYYSFGVVIVELLLGATSLHQAQLPDLYEFYLQGGRVEIPHGLPPRLAELLSGLLCRNRHRRWGGDEVARWLAGQTTEEDRQRIAEDQGYELGRTIAPFNAFETIKPTNLTGLSRALAQEPQVGLDELMSSDVMLNWIGQLDARVARQIRQDREEWRAHPRIALLCARLRLEPSAPLVVGGKRPVQSSEEWAKAAQFATSQKIVTVEELCQREALFELITWLRLKALPEPEAAARAESIVAAHFPDVAPDATAPGTASSNSKPVAKPNARLILEELCWAFVSTRPFPLARGVAAQTPQEIARLALGEAAEWADVPPAGYLSALQRWREGFLEAYLRQRLAPTPDGSSPLLAQMQKVRHDFPDKPFVAFEVVLRLLDPEIAPIEIELNAKAFEEVLAVRYGEQATLEIQYRARGAGMPYAALKLESQSEGLVLDEHEITHRRGVIKIRLNSQSDIPVGRKLRARLSLVGSTTQLAGTAPSLVYVVIFPVLNTVRKVAAGALIGAGLAGVARAALLPVVPQALHLSDVPLLARGTWSILFLVLLIAFTAAARIWFWALARHAR